MNQSTIRAGLLSAGIGGLSAQSASAGEPIKHVEIDDELLRLSAAISILMDTQAQLAGRLAPVSGPPSGCDSAKSVEPTPSSRVGQDIQQLRHKVEATTGYLQECMRILAI